MLAIVGAHAESNFTFRLLLDDIPRYDRYHCWTDTLLLDLGTTDCLTDIPPTCHDDGHAMLDAGGTQSPSAARGSGTGSKLVRHSEYTTPSFMDYECRPYVQQNILHNITKCTHNQDDNITPI